MPSGYDPMGVQRFSEKESCSIKNLERDDDRAPDVVLFLRERRATLTASAPRTH